MTHAPVVHSSVWMLVKPDFHQPGPASPCSRPTACGGREYSGGGGAGSLGTDVDDGDKAEKKDADEGYGGTAELPVKIGRRVRFRVKRGHEEVKRAIARLHLEGEGQTVFGTSRP
jgi:hypothetical protein